MINLIYGDCLEELPKLQDKSVDLVLADPPYGITACKWDLCLPFERLWSEIWRICKGAVCLFGSEPFSSSLRLSQIKYFKYDWIWKKSHPSNFVCAKKQPMRNHEIISVFYKKQCNYFYIKEKRECNSASMKRWTYPKNKNAKDNQGNNQVQGGLKAVAHKNIDPLLRYPTSIKYFENCKRNKLVHPTQKPVDLLEYLIKTYTNEGDTVLDFCMGSGSTGVACKNLNRKFIGIEKEKKYYDIAVKRCSIK